MPALPPDRRRGPFLGRPPGLGRRALVGAAMLGPGTSVRVGGIDQTDFLRAGSLTLRLNTFDFGLVGPVVAPPLGDLVHVLEPAWDGEVVGVRQTDPPKGTTAFYAVVA